MIIEFKCGDLLKTNAKLICHQVNCKGVMGAGVAKAIKERHPDAFYEYKEYCSVNSYDSKRLLGDVLLANSNGKIIASMFAQDGYGFSGTHTSYDMFKTCVVGIYEYAIKNGIDRIAMPFRIGCGLAGGDWEIVYGLLNCELPITLELWQLESTNNLFDKHNARLCVDGVEDDIVRGEFEGSRVVIPKHLLCECKCGDILTYSLETRTWSVDEAFTKQRANEINALWMKLNFKK